MIDPHHIQTLRFDLEIPSVCKNRDIQNRIVRVFNMQFTAMLNEVFEKYGKDEKVIVESLQLQLEPILLDQLEKNVIQQSREQLTTYFEKHKLKQDHIKLKRQKEVYNENYEEEVHPLLFYLIHGVYPWYLTEEKSFAVRWQNALSENIFLQQIKRMSWPRDAVKRLFYHLEEFLLQSTVRRLIPKYASQILAYHNQLNLFFDQNRIVKKSALTEVKQTAWMFSLEYILSGNTNQFSKSNFIRNHLQRVMVHNRLTIDDLIYPFSKALKKPNHPGAMANDLQQIFARIQSDLNVRSKDAIALNGESTIEAVEKCLRQVNKTKKDLALLRQWMVRSKNRSKIQQVWINPLRGRLLESAMHILVPESAPLIIDYHSSLWKLHAKESIASSFESFERTIWTFTFDYLTTSFSSVFQLREFVRYHTNKLSRYHQLDSRSFFQNLLKSIDSYRGSGTKYKELMLVLHELIRERSTIQEKEATDPNFKAKDLDIHQIKTILQNTYHQAYEQDVLIKSWLYKKSNWPRIQRFWIDAFDEKLLRQCIGILKPEQGVFIQHYMVTMGHFFMFNRELDCTSLQFKKCVYKALFEYLLAAPSNFRKNTFIQKQIRAITAEFMIKEKDILKSLNNYLMSDMATQIQRIDVLSVLNNAPYEQERRFSKNDSFSFIDKVDHRLLWQFFEKGELSPQNSVSGKSTFFKSLSFVQLETALEHTLLYDAVRWFSLVKDQGKPIQIHSTIEKRMNTSVLRSLRLFEINYAKWTSIELAVQKYSTGSLTNFKIAFFFFLEEGIIPQWVSKKTGQSIRKGDVTESMTTALLNYTWSLQSLHQWTYDITSEGKQGFLKNAAKGVPNHFVVQWYTNLLNIYNGIAPNKRPPTLLHFEMYFWQVFFFVYQTNSSVMSSGFVEDLLKKWEAEFKLNFNKNLSFLEVAGSSSYVPKIIMNNKNSGSILPNVNLGASNKNTQNTFSNTSGKNEKKPPIALEIMSDGTKDRLMKWHVGSAGLIIVHPFLIHLFGLLNYLDKKNQFKDEKSQMQAVYLMHYIATSQDGDINEMELSMPKILCGMTIQQAIPTTSTLTKKEKEMADELLHVLISRWEKLGKTSPDSLRNTFLIRSGLLEEKDKAYHLTIEVSGTDVLLDFIPWNIQMVQLPWLKQLIYISWR